MCHINAEKQVKHSLSATKWDNCSRLTIKTPSCPEISQYLPNLGPTLLSPNRTQNNPLVQWQWPLVYKAERPQRRADGVYDGRLMKRLMTQRLVSRVNELPPRSDLPPSPTLSHSIPLMWVRVMMKGFLSHRGVTAGLTGAPARSSYSPRLAPHPSPPAPPATSNYAFEPEGWGWKEAWLSVCKNQGEWASTCECLCGCGWMWKEKGGEGGGWQRAQTVHRQSDWLWAALKEGLFGLIPLF